MRRLKYILVWSYTVTVIKMEGSQMINVFALHTRYVGVDASTRFKPRFLLASRAGSSTARDPTPIKSHVPAAEAGKSTDNNVNRDLKLGVDGG